MKNASLSWPHRLRRKLGRSKTKLWRQLQQRTYNPDGRSIPAFLIGCGRSGTSMLVLQLGRSWQLDIYNENNSAAFENWFLRPLPVIQQLVAASRAPIVLFKPILETYRACLLLEQFPNAKILFTFRHYDDVINSSIKKFGPRDRIDHVNNWINDNFSEFADRLPPMETQHYIRDCWRPGFSPEEGAALYWLFQNRLYFDLGLVENDSAQLISYEAVVSNPVEEMIALCNFLGVNFEQQMAAGIFDSSIQRSPAPTIAPHLRQECEQMWQRLRRSARL
ncbi:MAG: hypothetical protein WAM60_04240 [Candidatus Promineifilaceae bacterium]